MMTPTTTPPSEVGTSAWFALKAPGDAYMLAEMGQAACGHCALAAVLQMPVMFIRGAFPAPLWVSEKTMTQALDKLGVKWHVISGWTERCVIWLQGLGSWMNPGVPMGARNQRTHWIAGSLHEGMKMVYDVNLGEWVTLDDWKADLLPDLLKAWKAKDFEVRTIINVRANAKLSGSEGGKDTQ